MILSGCSDKQPSSTDLMRTGLVFPSRAQTRIVGTVEADNIEKIFIHTEMSAEVFAEFLKQDAFKDVTLQKTSNPFVMLDDNVPGWEPKRSSEGLGGILNIRPKSKLIYFFSVGNADRIEGWLLVAM